MQQPDGIFQSLVRFQLHHDASRLGHAQPKIDQPGHRRFRQDAVADRAHHLQPGHPGGSPCDGARRLPVHHALSPRCRRKQVRVRRNINATGGDHELLHLHYDNHIIAPAMRATVPVTAISRTLDKPGFAGKWHDRAGARLTNARTIHAYAQSLLRRRTRPAGRGSPDDLQCRVAQHPRLGGHRRRSRGTAGPCNGTADSGAGHRRPEREKHDRRRRHQGNGKTRSGLRREIHHAACAISARPCGRFRSR